jgi:hypothetical protein
LNVWSSSHSFGSSPGPTLSHTIKFPMVKIVSYELFLPDTFMNMIINIYFFTPKHFLTPMQNFRTLAQSLSGRKIPQGVRKKKRKKERRRKLPLIVDSYIVCSVQRHKSLGPIISITLYQMKKCFSPPMHFPLSRLCHINHNFFLTLSKAEFWMNIQSKTNDLL